MRTIDKRNVCPYCGEITPQKPLPHLLLPGTVLKERYLIGNAVGQGGFGITYVGCDLLLNMRVAIKEYYPTGYASRNTATSADVTVTDSEHAGLLESGKDRFLQEARVLAEFNEEDGIVDVRDYFKENNTAYIVMEYLDGVTLLQCLSTKCIAPDLLVKMRTLEKLHSRQIIHRDISPDNIMVLSNGSMKLLDFGAARQMDYYSQKSMTVVMKPGFAPPEQYRSKGELGPWTDVYALCATIYMCITGHRPDDALERAFSDDMKWPSEMGVPITASLEQVLRKGMAPDRKDRYQTVGELREAFRNADSMDAESVSADYMTDSYGLGVLAGTIMEQNRGRETEFQKLTAGSKGHGETVIKLDDSAAASPKQENSRVNEKAASRETKKPKWAIPAAVLAAVLCAVIVFVIIYARNNAAAGQELPPGTFVGYTLEEIGSFEEPDIGTLDVKSNKLAVKYDDGTWSVLTAAGGTSDSKRYESIEQLRPAAGSDYSGYFAVTDPAASDENNKGLIDIDGNLLIPCESLGFDRLGTGITSDRYVEVYYSTGETTEDADYFISITTGDKGQRYYKGYTRVYDLKNKDFTGDLRINSTEKIYSCGDHFVVEDPEKVFTLYDAGGNTVRVFQAGGVNIGKGVVTARVNDISYVYDEDGSLLFSSPDTVYPVSGGSSYLKKYSSEGYVVLDKTGSQVLSSSYKDVYGERNGIFFLTTNWKNIQLIDLGGTVLYQADEYFYWITDSYWYTKSERYKNVLVGPCGKIGDRFLDIEKMTDKNNSGYFVINDRKYSLHLNDDKAQSLTYGMISAKEKSGYYMVYDLFTGQKLLPAEYSKIMYASGYIYALDGITWHVFRIERAYT